MGIEGDLWYSDDRCGQTGVSLEMANYKVESKAVQEREGINAQNRVYTD